MRSKWITHKGRQIFWQDFSQHYAGDKDEIKAELAAVQQVVTQQPEGSLLVLADFRDTQIGKDLLDLMIEGSRLGKRHIKKTAVLGVVGTKRILADILMKATGQPLTFFDDAHEAQNWLVED